MFNKLTYHIRKSAEYIFMPAAPCKMGSTTITPSILCKRLYANCLATQQYADLINFTGFTLHDTDIIPIEPLIDETLLACFKQQSYIIKECTTVNPGIVERRLMAGGLSTKAWSTRLDITHLDIKFL